MIRAKAIANGITWAWGQGRLMAAFVLSTCLVAAVGIFSARRCVLHHAFPCPSADKLIRAACASEADG
jgi:hypothetical protein